MNSFARKTCATQIHAVIYSQDYPEKVHVSHSLSFHPPAFKLAAEAAHLSWNLRRSCISQIEGFLVLSQLTSRSPLLLCSLPTTSFVPKTAQEEEEEEEETNNDDTETGRITLCV